MSIEYTQEKARGALQILARHTNPDLRYRIADAWIELLPARSESGMGAETELLWDRIRARIARSPIVEVGGVRMSAAFPENEQRMVIEALVVLCTAIVVEEAGGTPNRFLPGYLPN